MTVVIGRKGESHVSVLLPTEVCQALLWYVRFEDIRDSSGRLLSVSKTVSSMVCCFVDERVKPKMRDAA